jgi:hypothetical protein
MRLRRLPSKHSRGGYSLIEILCVLGCVAVAAGLLGGASWHVHSSMEIRNTALDFLQTVEKRCRVRITFQKGPMALGAAASLPAEEFGYRVHAFIVPSASETAARWVAMGPDSNETDGGVRGEWIRVDQRPRSASLVGRWVRSDLDPHLHRVPDSIAVSSPILTRFHEQKRDAFFTENYHAPETTWRVHATDLYESANCYSFFPLNYWLTPMDEGAVLLSGKLPESEHCVNPANGTFVPASTFWPGSQSFIRGVDEEKLQELPGIEFRPDGSLAATWSATMEVSFAKANQPQQRFIVRIEQATGAARIAREDY